MSHIIISNIEFKSLKKEIANRTKTLPRRSMQTTQSHWIELPSMLCQAAILLVCQLSKPGRTSLGLAVLAIINLVISLSRDDIFHLFVEFECCTFLLCFPLTFGAARAPVGSLSSSGVLGGDKVSKMISDIGLLTVEKSKGFSCTSSFSESAIKSYIEFVVISSADNAACSLKN